MEFFFICAGIAVVIIAMALGLAIATSAADNTSDD